MKLLSCFKRENELFYFYTKRKKIDWKEEKCDERLNLRICVEKVSRGNILLKAIKQAMFFAQIYNMSSHNKQ